jgi:hypothetical protein
VQTREFPVNADRLGHLTEFGEGAGEQLERLDVRGRGLEARLQARERAAGITSAQVDLGDEPQVLGVLRREVGDTLAHLNGLVPALTLVKLLEDDLELLDRLRVLVLPGESLGEADAVGNVVRCELDDLLEEQHAVAVPPLALVGTDHELVLTDRVRGETELHVELGELQVGSA